MTRSAPPHHLALVLALIVAAVAVPPGTTVAGASPGAGLPPDDAAAGLVYDGLARGRPGGPCGDLFEIRHADRFLGCTHGPDPAPAGVDVRRHLDLQGLRARSGPAVNGPDTSGIPCVGDGTSGNRVQAIYAHASNVPDRFTAISPLIASWAAVVNDVVNASAAETAGQRQIRWVTTNCQLSILDVTLSPTGDDNFSNTLSELRAQGFTAPSRKYLVWMDASILCGLAQIMADDQPGSGNANNGPSSVPGLVARIDTGCWGSLPFGHSGEAHELGHMLGAVQSSAPHPTAFSHCTDEYDTMCYNDGTAGEVVQYPCTFTHDALYDCGHDDYFSTAPAGGSYLSTHWNTANSSFLTGTLAPRNDAFANREVFPPVVNAGVGSNVGATAQSGEPTTAGVVPSHSVWYEITAPSTGGTLTFDTEGSTFDTVLGAYTGGGVGSLTAKATNDDAKSSATWSRISFATAGGTSYKIKVDGKSGATGRIVLHVGFGGAFPDFTGFTPTSGVVGTTVTVSGTNLLGNGSGLRPSFNGFPVSAFLSGTTSTSLKMAVPPGTVTGPIYLWTSFGYAQTIGNFVVKPSISGFTPTSGPVGTAVTINGSAFLGATAVKFNGTLAAIRSIAYGQIVATVPSGATTGKISVTTPAGTATSTANFTVT